MTGSANSTTARPISLFDRWRVFWFREQSTYTLGLVRMAFGTLTFVWAMLFLPDLYEFFGKDGAFPQPPQGWAHHWGVFHVWPSDHALLIGWGLLVVASIALAVGWHSRLAALIVFVLILSFMSRNPNVFNAGDGVVRITALLVALSPCGTALSLDQRRRTGSFWSAESRPRWPLRLMQIQLSLIYIWTVQGKLAGESWLEGTALWYVWRHEDWLGFVTTPDWVVYNALLVNVATWSALAIEVAMGILIWNRRLRPWVMTAGVLLHVSIFFNMSVGLFSPSMFVLYLAFIPPETVEKMPPNLARSLSRIRNRIRRERAPHTGEHRGAESPVPANAADAPPVQAITEAFTATGDLQTTPNRNGRCTSSELGGGRRIR